MSTEKKAEPRQIRLEESTEEQVKLLAEKEDRKIVDMTRVLIKRGIAKTLEDESDS